jgi:hypothetical protein
MTSETSNADVLDAVAMELSRFSRDVVTEVHRLRDELVIEQQRLTALEAEVAELRRTGMAPVSPVPPAEVVVQAVVQSVETHADPVTPPSPESELAAPATFEFAPLTLHAVSDPPPSTAGLDHLARVLADLSEPIAVHWPTDD